MFHLVPYGDPGTVREALWTWGWWLVLVAASLALGLVIGAETTALVTIDSPAKTPGIFGPHVAVAGPYLIYWEASKAMAIVGITAMFAAQAARKYYEE